MPSNSFHPYHFTYLKNVLDFEPIEALQKAEFSCLDLISKLSEEQMNSAYELNKWTVKDVLQHLIDTERVFSYRALHIARDDSNELKGYDHLSYAKASQANKRTKVDLVDEYQLVRKSSICLLNSFTDEILDKVGFLEGEKLSVAAIFFIIAGHDLHHLSVLNSKYLLS